MTFQDVLLELFYLIDTEYNALNLPRLRRRGPAPRLHDTEVITIVLAGELLGLDTDKGIWRHFRRYHQAEFPMLTGTDRTRFARQAADLWRVTQLLHERLVGLLPTHDPAAAVCGGEGGGDGQTWWLIDSFPLRVCRFKRAPGHKLFRACGAAYGRDPTDGKSFYGFRVHLRITDGGFCCAIALAPANVADWPMVAELLPPPPGSGGATGVGDRNYWNPDGQAALQQQQGFTMLAPFRKQSSDPAPLWSAMLGRFRQIIEPVIGQLATRFHCQRTWARDLWHLTARLSRKLLSHTAAVLLNWRAGNPPLKLELLITD